jgi:SAM-dependent methyltransferase
MNPFSRILNSLRTRGAVQSAIILKNELSDRLFDWRYGTDTQRWVPREEIETTSLHRADSQPYKATRRGPLIELLRQLKLPSDSHFVDIGAGKGRVVLIAAECRFRKVIGVEFSGALCRIARRNIEIISSKKIGLTPMEVVEADATLYRLGPHDCVLFLYNPFHEGVMAKFIENVRHSLAAHPRKLWLIYNDPLHHPVIARSGVFQLHQDYLVGGTEFRVYTAEAA